MIIEPTKAMPDLYTYNENESALRQFYEGDRVFVPQDSARVFDYQTNSFTGEVIPTGVYTIGSWCRCNGLETRMLTQTINHVGGKEYLRFEVSPEIPVSLVERYRY